MNRRFSFFVLIVIVAIAIYGCGTAEKDRSKDKSEKTAIPSLAKQLADKTAAFASSAPPEMIETFRKGIEQVGESGVLESALKKGDKAPDFELPDVHGKSIKLSDLLKTGPVVLTWYRGGWCPYCNIQLNAYNQALDSFKAARGQLVAVSPNVPDSSLSTSERNNLQFEVLSDVGNKVAKEYGLVYTLPESISGMMSSMIDFNAYDGNNDNQLPLAATYVIDADGTIQYAFIDADYKKRAETSELIAVLESLKR